MPHRLAIQTNILVALECLVAAGGCHHAGLESDDLRGVCMCWGRWAHTEKYNNKFTVNFALESMVWDRSR